MKTAPHVEPSPEEVGEVLHGVGPDAGDVGELARVVQPQRPDLVPHVVRHLHPDLHS